MFASIVVLLYALNYPWGTVGDALSLPYCTTGGLASQKATNISISSFTLNTALPNVLGLVHTCRFEAPSSASLLRIKARKRTREPGSLHVDVYDSEQWRILGSHDVSSFNVPSEKCICLSNTHRGLPSYITFSGTPGLAFSADVTYPNYYLELDKHENFNISTDTSFIFQFNISKDIVDSQLDITVTSDDFRKAYLVVSYYCNRVEGKNRGIINIKKPSMVLTFERKGRITMSKVSQPALKLNKLFIGVYMGDVVGHENTTKSVQIELRKSFSYEYAEPICFLFFMSLFSGIIIALWALVCFREPLKLVENSPVESTSSSMRSSIGNSTSTKTGWKRFFSCLQADAQGELEPLIAKPRRKIPSAFCEIFTAMWIVSKYHWLGKGPKTFSYITCIVGCVLMVGAFQFVFENWNVMVTEGNRDMCFYNDFCYRVSHTADIPFNLMISNLVYMIHGTILAWAVWVMEAKLYVQAKKRAQLKCQTRSTPVAVSNQEPLPQHALVCSNMEAHIPQLSVPKFDTTDATIALRLYTYAYKKKYSFSIGYAFAWALLFEGFFSLTYHFCPSKMTFQFDSAFMLVIAGLIMLSLYNGLSVKECHEENGNPKPIEATAFFLFAIVPLFILNYAGYIYDKSNNTNDSLIDGTKILFIIAMTIWYMLMYLWAGYKLFYNHCFNVKNNFKTCPNITKLTLFCITIVCTCVVIPILFRKDVSNVFLFSSIAACLLSVIGRVLIKTSQSVPRYWNCERIFLRGLQVLYIVVFLGTMAAAVSVFLGFPTTDKTLSPAQSRNLNEECALLNFFDDHDIWHILSSFGLLMGAFLVMFISE